MACTGMEYKLRTRWSEEVLWVLSMMTKGSSETRNERQKDDIVEFERGFVPRIVELLSFIANGAVD